MGQSYDFSGIPAQGKAPFNGPRLVTAPAPTFDFSGIPTAEESVTESRKKLAAANANYEAHPPEMEHPKASDQWSRQAMGQRAIQGMKGEAEGFVGGLAGAATAAYQVVRHPIATTGKVGDAALMLGMLAKQAIDDPQGALTSLKDAAVRFGSDPENIGMAAGAVDAAIATPAIVKAASNTRIGQALGLGVSEAASPASSAADTGITEEAIKKFASGQPMSASDAVDILKAVPKEQRAALLAERAKVTTPMGRLSRPKPSLAPGVAVSDAAAPAAVTPTATPSAASTFTPSPLQKMFGMKPGVEPSPTQLSSSVRLAEIRAKATLTAAEKASVIDLVKQGTAPEVALEQIKPNAALQFSQKFGLPSVEDATKAVAERNRTGRWPKSPNYKQVLAKANKP